MTTTLFTDGWLFHRVADGSSTPVRLPHDAMISEVRSADAGTGNHGAFFPGGEYRYSKQWQVPADAGDLQYAIFFEGVYGDTVVTVDGAEVARSISGYRAFSAPLGVLDRGATVSIEVVVDNSKSPNSRWYTGSGIYRQVWLESTPAAHIVRDGVRLVTREFGTSAVVEVDVDTVGAAAGDVVSIEFSTAEGLVASTQLPLVNGRAAGNLEIARARGWSAEDPYLYDVRVALSGGDERVIRFGLRTLTIDPANGLRINGREVLLRGACVHHDHGILGAVSLPASEHRRARLLKENGYNAVRASHQPMSRAFLDACDELGLYVLDELTDVWFQHKTPHDTADSFAELWRDDARAMVEADRNRPSVIMYSLGNEIGETSVARGITVSAEIHDFVHELDPTRPTTLAINLLVNLMVSKGKSPFDKESYTGDGSGNPQPKKKPKSSTAANAMTAKLGRIMNLLSLLPAADKASRGAFATVDIAGYNYAYVRYPADRKRHPERVILGTESMPGDLPAIWKRVQSVPGVIGDFMWTGWDYLGEAGIGVWSYGSEFGGINKPFPALLAGPGAIDITGLRGAPALLAQAVWGLLDAPAIAVRPMEHIGKRANKSPWRSTDAVESWSWQGSAGTAEIEVYSSDDEVELTLNGRSLGTKRAGARVGFVTRFSAPYTPGDLVAIGYRNGLESGRSTLRTAGAAALRLRVEEESLRGPDTLAHVWVELADEHGVVETGVNDEITITVHGPATLAGLGSAAPITAEQYTDNVHTTHFGRALAILRGTGAEGTVTIGATSKRYGTTEISLASTDDRVGAS